MSKGIQLDLKAAKTWLTWFKIKFTTVSTLCKFHIGGFFAPLGLTSANSIIVFNHGPDLESDGDACEILYQEIDKFKPSVLAFGSHNLVVMGKQPPKNKLLNLSSVLFAMPTGSTLSDSLYSNLKTSLPALVSIIHPYGMTELAGKALNNTIQKYEQGKRCLQFVSVEYSGKNPEWHGNTSEWPCPISAGPQKDSVQDFFLECSSHYIKVAQGDISIEQKSLKFKYSEKATKFSKIPTVDFTITE